MSQHGEQEREQIVLEAIHRSALTDRAPDSLRTRIDALRRAPRRAPAPRRVAFGTAAVGVLAAAALAVALALPGGTPGGPSLSQAAGLAARGPTQAAPSPDSDAPTIKLNRDVQEVYFPNWESQFHWRAVGQRTDKLGGRPATTVYYAWRGRQIAYTIVSAPALPQPSASVTQLSGTTLRTLTLDGRLVVTWRRKGHTCILSGTGVPAMALQRLAAWKTPATSD